MTGLDADLATLRKACENAQGADFDAGFIDAREVFAERIAALDRVEAHITRLTQERNMARAGRDQAVRDAKGRGVVQYELLARAEAAERALALIAALTSRQADVLVATEGAVLEEDGETLDEIAARLGCSVGTVVNEQRRVAALLDRHSENDDQTRLVLRKVLDLLYGEGEEE